MKVETKRLLLLCAGLAGLFVLTEWNWFTAPFERDEGEYAYSAWIMGHGGVPYRDTFLQKPPMIVYTYWLAQRISDTAVWPPRAVAAIFVILTAGIVWLIARRMYGTRCAWISAWLFVPMLAFPYLVPMAANTEKFMNLPLLATVALHLHGRNKSTPWIWMAAGACASLALLYKPLCLLLLVFVFAVWLTETMRREGGVRLAVRQAGCLLIGGAAVAALALSYVLIHGALHEMWEEAVLFNQAYASIFGWSARYFIRYAASFGHWWWPLLLATAWFLYERPARWWYFSVLLLLALASAYKVPHGHYYLMVVPFWALIAAQGIDGFAAWASRCRPFAWATLLTAITVILLCLPLREFLFLSPDTLVARTYINNPFVESPLAARKLAQWTEPNSRVFIAGSEPQILFYAKRRQISRFDIMYPLMLPTPFVDRFQNEAMQALRTNPPDVVVFSRSQFSWTRQPNTPPAFWSFLMTLLKDSYHPVGGCVLDNARCCWQEPLDPRKDAATSLIVFRRNASVPGVEEKISLPR